jgi:hypothetical protein
MLIGIHVMFVIATHVSIALGGVSAVTDAGGLII